MYDKQTGICVMPPVDSEFLGFVDIGDLNIHLFKYEKMIT